MPKITVTQIDWNGLGDDRSFTYWPDRRHVEEKLDQIAAGYHMSGGRVRVELDGQDITARMEQAAYDNHCKLLAEKHASHGRLLAEIAQCPYCPPLEGE